MQISFDLLVVILIRVAILTACGSFLFRIWFQASKRYYSDLPFLMGVSFIAIAGTKIFDIWLYELFMDSSIDDQFIWHPSLPVAYFRWLLMLVVIGPVVFLNLRIWLPNRSRLRNALLAIYVLTFIVLIFQAKSFYALNALVAPILFPPAILTVITFLFTFIQRRLPEVHGLLIGLGWLGYILSSIIRPFLMSIGPPPWGMVSVAELLDMSMWIIIFLGFILKPTYSQKKQEVIM